MDNWVDLLDSLNVCLRLNVSTFGNRASCEHLNLDKDLAREASALQLIPNAL